MTKKSVHVTKFFLFVMFLLLAGTFTNITEAAPELAVSQSSCSGLTQEAEDGIISGNKFVIGSRADASGGEYIYVPNQKGNLSRNLARNRQYVSYCFDVPADGDYKIEGVVASIGRRRHLSNSFFVQVDNLPRNGYLWDTTKSRSFMSDYVSDRRRHSDPVIVNLTAGQHTIKIHLREAGTLLDTISLVPLNPIPTATATSTPTVIPPTATPIPPTSTPTVIPPTATPIPPTSTPTVILPTATPIPPTSTPTVIPPTATSTPQASDTLLIISEIVDATLPGGLPKFVEITNVGTAPIDLSQVSIGNFNNGSITLGGDSVLLSGTLNACESYVISYENSDAPGVGLFFDTYGFNPDFFGLGAFINGDDVVAIFDGVATGDGSDATMIDVYGVIGVDGTGQAWEYTDGYSFRHSGITAPNPAFTADEWTIGGANSLETGDDVEELALILSQTTPGTTADCGGTNPTPTPIGPTATPVDTPTPENTPTPGPTGTPPPVTSDVVITGLYDGPLTGGEPKGIEVCVVNDVADLSIYGIGSANNGGGTDGQEFAFPAGPVSAGTFIYIANQQVGFTNFFGFAADHISGSMAINGDDAVELFKSGAVVDTFGDIAVDGNGTPWEYLDGWAYRNNGTGPDGSAFVLSSWSFSGANQMEGGTTNGTVTSPFPIGSYSSCTPTGPTPTPTATVTPTGTPTSTTLIHEIQGSGDTVAITAQVLVEAVVVGDFEDNDQLDGFYIQEQDADADADASTSEGIFVYCGADNCGSFVGVNIGDLVEVVGSPVEFGGQSQIAMTAVTIVSNGNALPTAATIDLPVTALTDLEAFEGMRVQMADKLFVTEHFNLGRYGETTLTSNSDRQYQGTHVAAPGAPALAHAAANQLDRIVLDDGRTGQNPDPLVYPVGFNASNPVRGGDSLAAGFTGVLGEGFSVYRIQPTGTVNFTSENPRPAAPDAVGGDIKIASMNVLNFFTGLDGAGSICGPAGNQDCRGADSASEFGRQRDKILAALTALDADVVGLVELENNATASLQSIVDGLNATAGAGTWGFVNTGTIGTDAIKVGYIYKTAVMSESGAFAVLDSNVDSTYLDTKNRPVLAQTFEVIDAGNGSFGGKFTAAITHLKSKGSACTDVSDPDAGDGQGNCNGVRTAAATAMANWLATDPTESGDADVIIFGDLNAYKMEDPITALKNAGYTDLIEQFLGNDAYSYVFSGEWGYLDYALSNTALTPQVTGTTEWHINADEPRILDYNEEFQSAGQVTAWYNADQYRSSDHDVVVVGLALDVPALTTDLIISEYIEGSSNNKAIEIFNGTGADIDLAAGGYSIELYSNGAAAAGSTLLLTGLLADSEALVIANGSAGPALLALADQTSSVANFNGDDGLALKKVGVIIDSFGQVGTDPGSEWTGGGQNDTLRRNSAVCTGDANFADAFDASVEWSSFAIDSFDGLGSHTVTCSP